MMIDNYLSGLTHSFNQFLGWKTKRKIVVIESDDWGSIRMPSSQTLNCLKESGFKLDSHYNKYDSLETISDLSALFDTLSDFRNANCTNPVITANYVVANPDFEKIKESNFAAYCYEIFTETYKKQKNCESSFSTLEQGIKNKIFRPQFHAREHLNVNLWMKALQEGHTDTMAAFENRFWGHRVFFPGTHYRNFLSAYDFQKINEISAHQNIITDGLKVFENIFGYRSESFVATNYTWHPLIEKTLSENGVSILQGLRWQLIPQEGQNKYNKKWRVTGTQNAHNQIQLVRNVKFEPSENQSLDWENICLKGISDAFFWRKPAIITCHRVNFIGAIDPENRDRNLQVFKSLLGRILKLWPDVEFMTSDELGKIILQEKQNLSIRP